MSKGGQPKTCDVHILLGGNLGLHTSKEKQSNPDDIAEAPVNTLFIEIKKRGSSLHTLPNPAVITSPLKIAEMVWIPEPGGV